MTGSKILSLKNPLSLKQEAKLRQLMGLAGETEEKMPQKKKPQEKKPSKDDSNALHISKGKRLREATQWLVEAYPECFNFQNPKPLRIGIVKDIYLEGKWPHSKTFLRETLAFYVGSPTYQRTLLEEPHRVSLTGEIIDEVTGQQKSAAAERLTELKARKEAIKANKFGKKKENLNVYEKESLKKAANENA